MISGTGSVTKTGAGKLTVSGENTYTGGTTINEGVLDVSGTILGPISVNGDGTLCGIGNVGSITNNGGRLAPGTSIGTLTIKGDYTHNAGSTYTVEVDAAGNSDLIDTTGQITLNGGTLEVQATDGTYNFSTDYTFLKAAGGVTGTFEDVSSNFAFLTPSLTYNPNDIVLTLTRNNYSFASVALTENQRATAQALDSAALSASGDMATVMNVLMGLSSSEAQTAFDQTAGASHSAFIATSFNIADRHLRAVSRRLESFRLGAPSRFGPLAMTERESFRDTKSFSTEHGPDLISPPDIKWNIWASTFGASAKRTGNALASRYGYNIYGIAGGLDFRFSPNLLAGIGGGFSTTTVDLDLLPDSGKVKSYQATLYTSYLKDLWYLEGMLSYARKQFDTHRGLAFGGLNRIADGDYNANEYAGYVEGGFRFNVLDTDIRPLITLQITHLSMEDYTETGAGALNLAITPQDITFARGSLGVLLTKEYRISGGIILKPQGRAHWIHEFSGDEHPVNAWFSESTAEAFTVKGNRPPRDSMALGLGLSAMVKKGLDLYIDYDASLSEDLVSHAFSAGLVFTW